MSRFIDFASDPQKRADLIAALANPIVAEAFDVAKDMMEPRVGTQAAPPGLHTHTHPRATTWTRRGCPAETWRSQSWAPACG